MQHDRMSGGQLALACAILLGFAVIAGGIISIVDYMRRGPNTCTYSDDCFEDRALVPRTSVEWVYQGQRYPACAEHLPALRSPAMRFRTALRKP